MDKEKDNLTEDKMKEEMDAPETAQKEQNEDPSNDDGKQVEIGAELAEAKDKYLRLFAEFENYKKRTFKEKLDLMKTAAQDTMGALLPVIDDFDRAQKAAQDMGDEQAFPEGINLIYQKMIKALEGKGLKVMESTGEAFDPEHHEAITEISAPSDDMKGKVIDTVEKGYILNDKIIRYAKVVVGK